MADSPVVRIVHGQVEEDGKHWIIHNRSIREDGTETTGVNIFPKDAMEWRAAEYGIPITEVDTLLDIVLAEPYLTAADWAEGVHLFASSNTQEAREAHLARVAKAKLRMRITTRTKDPEPIVRSFLADKLGTKEATANNFDFVRVQSDLEDDVVMIKRAAVRTNIKSHQEETKKPERTRLERVRDELGKRNSRG